MSGLRKNHYLTPAVGRFNNFESMRILPYARKYNKISGNFLAKRLGGPGTTKRKDIIVNPKPVYFKFDRVKFEKFYSPALVTAGIPSAGARYAGSGRSNLHGNDRLI